jgi:multidrug efflux pump subunit AcrB
MVHFFIGRPIFATVIALLMLLVGGLCIVVLPIALDPPSAPDGPRAPRPAGCAAARG